jgi:hypothetical protein
VVLIEGHLNGAPTSEGFVIVSTPAEPLAALLSCGRQTAAKVAWNCGRPMVAPRRSSSCPIQGPNVLDLDAPPDVPPLDRTIRCGTVMGMLWLRRTQPPVLAQARPR